MAEYISAKEAARLWNITERSVTGLCRSGRIEGAVKNGLLGVDFLFADADVVFVIAAGEIVALGNHVKTVGDVLCDAVFYVIYNPDEGVLTGAVIKHFAELKGQLAGLIENTVYVFLKCREPFFSQKFHQIFLHGDSQRMTFYLNYVRKSSRKN